MVPRPNLFILNFPADIESKNNWHMTFSIEMILLAKSRPSMNQSESLDLTQDYLAIE